MRLPVRAGMKWTMAGVFVSLCCPPTPAQRIEVEPRSRMFSVTMRTIFDAIPPDLERLSFWFPMPFQDDAQAIYNRFVLTAYGPEFHYSPDTGNEFIYMTSPPRHGQPMNFRFNFEVERFEDLRNDFGPREENNPTPEEEKRILERWLRAESGMEITEDVRKLAGKITADAKKTHLKARAIYDHIVTGFALRGDPELVDGSDHGHLARTLSGRSGNSVDLAAAFVGLCRAAGIPARTVMGLKIPSGVEKGTLTTYHGWAEFYVEGTGWIPVDPADGQANPGRRSYYFGALEEDRLTVSIGRDIMLVPPQEAEPLKYLITPYWEGNARPMPLPTLQWEFTSLTAIQNKPLIRVPSPARLQETQPGE